MSFCNLPIKENTLDAFTTLFEFLHERAPTFEELASLISEFDMGLLDDTDVDRVGREDVAYASAYIHGIGDALDMTVLEVLDRWQLEACTACGRSSEDCSAAPCADVERERGETELLKC